MQRAARFHEMAGVSILSWAQRDDKVELEDDIAARQTGDDVAPPRNPGWRAGHVAHFRLRVFSLTNHALKSAGRTPGANKR